MSGKLKVGITVGDFNGIGPELILRSLSNPVVLNYCTPVIYGNVFLFRHYAQLMDMELPEFNSIREPGEIEVGKINLRTCSQERIEITPGQSSAQSAAFALEALEMAVSDVKNGYIDNVLTAPIDKHTAMEAGLEFAGHTGYLAQAFESDALMILISDEMKVAMVTGHTALEQVPGELSTERIMHTVRRFAHSLTYDFNITRPRIALLGLNPHMGDQGVMGNQESELIAPAVKQLQEEGLIVIGPYSPDAFFGSRNLMAFDGVVGMYHDQVLIPFKQISFTDGVNFTAGLPIIRTSPDHGTAFEIAGKGVADISSFVNALYLINKVHRNRIRNYDINTSFLPFKEHRREKFSIGVPDLK